MSKVALKFLQIRSEWSYSNQAFSNRLEQHAEHCAPCRKKMDFLLRTDRQVAAMYGAASAGIGRSSEDLKL